MITQMKMVGLARKFIVLASMIFCGWPFTITRGDEYARRVDQRFGSLDENAEVPDFQKHVSPLLGRVGCNGRACHGSFQGQGGLRLSLFGYDFEADHQALLAEGTGRVDLSDPQESLILLKPTDATLHEGGQRFPVGSWQYNLIKRWIENGAEAQDEPVALTRLEVIPQTILFQGTNQTQAIQVIAHWADGVSEDVTPLSRFQTNDPQIATVDENGLVTSGSLGDSHVIVFYDNGVVPIPVIRPFPSTVDEDSGESKTVPAEEFDRRVDQLVQEKLDLLNLRRSERADDLTFLRRVSLDIAGTLPSPDMIDSFLVDPDPRKREKYIDQLLESPAYVAWWTTFLCDITGNNSQELRDVGVGSDEPSRQWYDWIEHRVARNTPYDEIAAGIIVSNSRKPDESYYEYCASMSQMASEKNSEDFAARETMPYYWMRRENQDRETRAIGFAQNFLGQQIQCAQCHKHPFDRWSQKDFEEFSRFFTGMELSRGKGSRVDQADFQKIMSELNLSEGLKGGKLQKALAEALNSGKVVPFAQLVSAKPKIPPSPDKAKPKSPKGKGNRGPAYFTEGKLLGSDPISFQGSTDVRALLWKWTRSPENPYFARAFVNRVWARYFGRGIVNPIDDLNLANPPSNEPLLDYLAEQFVAHQFDMKWLHREIANSRTYQTSWVPSENNSRDERNFSRAIPRRLPAELVLDAIAQTCATDSDNHSFWQTVSERAIAVPGTSYGRAARKERNIGFAFEAFGRSTRSTNCDCDRSNETSLIQTVYLQNDKDVHTWISAPDGWVSQMVGATPDTQQLAQLKKQLAGTRSRIQRLDKSRSGLSPERDALQHQKIDERIREFETVAHEIEQRLEQLQRPAVEVNTSHLIERAYWRSLSRPPTESELARCQSFFGDSKDLRQGLSGVLWALINSKEFIVNH